MMGTPGGRRGRRARGGVAIAVVVAGCGLWQPGLAAAAGVTLRYGCEVGVPMSAHVMWHLPPRVTVGRPTPAVRITATATVSTFDPVVFGFAGVTNIDGTGDAAGAIVAPGGTVDTTLHLTVAPTPVPASGPMTFHAAGTLSIPVFRQPGRAVVDVGTALDLTLTPRNANGNQVFNPLVVPCTLNPAQDPQLFSFDIGPAPTATPDPVTRRVAPAGTPGQGSAGPTSAAGPPASSTADAPVSKSAPPITATSSPARDSAAVSNRRRLPADWWLSVLGTMAVVAGAVGAAGWLRARRRTRGS